MENKYGHLLDKYMDGSKKYTNSLLEKEEQDKKEEGKNRYGNLLDNAKPNNKLYDDMLAVDQAINKLNQKREEENKQLNIRRQERIEREKQEEQRHRDLNDKYVNAYLEKKKAEQEAIKKKKEEEAKKQDFYELLERLIKINPHLAEVYLQTRNKI